jgi:hypothetical protein
MSKYGVNEARAYLFLSSILRVHTGILGVVAGVCVVCGVNFRRDEGRAVDAACINKCFSEGV